MIIDAHTHLGKKNIVATAAELIASMENAKVDKALVLAGKINQHATEEMLVDIAPYEGRLYGIGSVSPVNMGLDEHDALYALTLKAFEDGKLYGLKFYPGYEHYYPYERWEILRSYLRLCVKFNKPAIFHSGDLFNKIKGAKLKYAHPLHIDELAVEMPT